MDLEYKLKERGRTVALLCSIFSSCLGYFALHASIFALVGLQIGLFLNTIRLGIGLLLAYHIALVGVLLMLRVYMVHVPSGDPLYSLNAPMLLTLFRVSSIPLLVVYIIIHEYFPVSAVIIIYCVLAFLSDLLDGRVARRFNACSQVGAIFDSISDYCILIVLSVLYMYYNILPMWFVIVVIARLTLQFIFALIISAQEAEMYSPAPSSMLAKTSIFVIMLVFGLALLQFLPVFAASNEGAGDLAWFTNLLHALCWLSLPVHIASAVEKTKIFIEEF